MEQNFCTAESYCWTAWVCRHVRGSTRVESINTTCYPSLRGILRRVQFFNVARSRHFHRLWSTVNGSCTHALWTPFLSSAAAAVTDHRTTVLDAVV